MPEITLLHELEGQTGPPSQRKWSALCHCGEGFEARLHNIRSGGTTSCGCRRRKPGNFEADPVREVSGQTGYPSQRQWVFRCKCGTEFVARLQNVKSGRTRSCGCMKNGNGRPPAHGLAGTPVYQRWAYAKRQGIDPIWDNFPQFLADMGESHLPLAKIDPDQPHSPANSYWDIPPTEEVDNLHYAGHIKPLSHWAHEAGLPTAAVKCRLRRGWSVPFALQEP